MKVLGQDLLVLKNQIEALVFNVIAWAGALLPSWLRVAAVAPVVRRGENACVAVQGPGGLDRLQMMSLHQHEYPYSEMATVGYNVPTHTSPFVKVSKPYSNNFAPDLVLIRVDYFSVNYADVCIRWGLYESALRYVGWPIVPGFDFSGSVVWAGEDTDFEVGDAVFGFTMFGAYSTLLLVPARQIRKTPKGLAAEKAAGLPAVAATALHAIALAGGWPRAPLTKNKAALVHSAAGGVGSTLLQMLRLCGYSPIVAVVGSPHKVQHCMSLGADEVIVKDTNKGNLWHDVRRASPDGYAAIFDANGVETLSQSYEHLSLCGKLVIYGFHSNVPKASSLLSPMAWLGMIYKMAQMPRFDPMQMVLESKSVSGFNLSFFASEHDLIAQYMAQIVEWVASGALRVGESTVFDMKDLPRAHELIQSGSTVGKLVIRTPPVAFKQG